MTLYSPKDVAEIVGVTVVTLCHWRKKNIGPNWTKYGALVYYPAGDLRDYIERIGPIPAGMTGREKQTFFTNAHKTPNPEPAPEPAIERKAPEPAIEPAFVTELAARVTALEKALIRLRANRPKRRIKRRYVKKRTAANTLPSGKRKPRVTAGAPKVPTPEPVIPY